MSSKPAFHVTAKAHTGFDLPSLKKELTPLTASAGPIPGCGSSIHHKLFSQQMNSKHRGRTNYTATYHSHQQCVAVKFLWLFRIVVCSKYKMCIRFQSLRKNVNNVFHVFLNNQQVKYINFYINCTLKEYLDILAY